MKKCFDNSIFMYSTDNEGKSVIGNSWEVCKDLKNKIFNTSNFYLDYFFKVSYVMIKIL